jgi:hypothetical protein
MKALTEHLWFETRVRVEFINITPKIEELVGQIGVLAFLLTDEDPAKATLTMKGYATYFGRWLGTLQRDDEIRAFQASDRTARPWIHFARKSA